MACMNLQKEDFFTIKFENEEKSILYEDGYPVEVTGQGDCDDLKASIEQFLHTKFNISKLIDTTVYQIYSTDILKLMAEEKEERNLYWFDLKLNAKNYVVNTLLSSSQMILGYLFTVFNWDFSILKLLEDYDGYIIGPFLQAIVRKNTPDLSLSIRQGITIPQELFIVIFKPDSNNDFLNYFKSILGFQTVYDMCIINGHTLPCTTYTNKNQIIKVVQVPRRFKINIIVQTFGLNIFEYAMNSKYLIEFTQSDEIRANDGFQYLSFTEITKLAKNIKNQQIKFKMNDIFLLKMKHLFKSNWSQILEWNLLMSQLQEESLPRFLLTIPDGKNYNVKNLKVVPYFVENTKYLWRIKWKNLSEEQKTSSFSLDESLNSATLQWKTLNISIQDLLDPIFQTKEFEEKIFNQNYPSTCFNAQMADDVDLKTYLAKNAEKRIVFFVAKRDGSFNAACTKRSTLKDYALYFYQCAIENGYHRPDLLTDIKYVKIQAFAHPYLITNSNLKAILKSTSQFFIIQETPFVLKYTISEKAWQEMNTVGDAFVSADHCQEGSDKQLAIIYPLKVANLEEAIESINKRQRR